MDASRLTVDQIRATLEASERRKAAMLARDDLLGFTQFTMPGYVVKRHHRIIADALMDAESGKLLEDGFAILCISVGPQKGKSELCSRRFPAWAMGRNPKRNIMLGAYNQDFANGFGEEVRSIMRSDGYAHVFPEVRLRTGSKAKDSQVTEDGGHMLFLGRGAGGTGWSADIFLIDDPIKNDEEAQSETIRNQVWEWFKKVVVTRGHGRTVIIIIQTRWHEDDLVGRLTDKQSKYYVEELAQQVCYLNLPSIVDSAEIANLLGVPIGGSIWEEKFPIKMLRTRRALDPIAFGALEMGQPTPPEGAFFKRDHIVTYDKPSDIPEGLRMYGACDLAVTPETQGNSSVILNGGVDQYGDLWILSDVFWDKVASDGAVEWLTRYCLQYGWFQAFGEKGQIDRAVGPFLVKEAMRQGATACTAMTTFATNVGDKGNRSIAIRGHMTRGQVHFPRYASWWSRALNQLLKFSGTGDNREDDFVDALALFGQGLNLQVRGGKGYEKKGNVIKVGTFGWIKQQSNREREAEARMRRFGGM